MDWLTSLMLGGSAAQAVVIIGLTAALGLAIGGLRFWGVSLGVGGVLFAGLAVGATPLRLNPEIMEFAREFGLILFVYSVGLQVGPGFFSSLKRQGLVLNMLALTVIGLGTLAAVAVGWLFDLPSAVWIGMLSGAVTNTPSLGAAQQALTDASGGPDMATLAGAGYAAAYPLGVLGLIGTMLALKAIFKADPAAEAAAMMVGDDTAAVAMADIEVTNPEVAGMSIRELRRTVGVGFVVTRRLRDGIQEVANPGTTVAVGDLVHAVGARENLERLRDALGRLSKVHLPELSSSIQLRRIVVTNPKVTGKTIHDLQLGENWGIVVSRIIRSGVEFAPRSGVHLHFGDRLVVVGVPQALDHVAAQLGDQIQELDRSYIMPVFLGIALGVLLGSIPLTVGEMPAPVRLGLAGGPLIVAVIVGRLGRLGPFLCHVPNPAKKLLAEVGICLFLACVGLKSGPRFLELLADGTGFGWMAIAMVITVVPALIVGLFARSVLKMNYAGIIGVLAGSMTDPPALAYANQACGNDAPSVSYATVYPLTLLLRVVVAQLLVLYVAG